MGRAGRQTPAAAGGDCWNQRSKASPDGSQPEMEHRAEIRSRHIRVQAPGGCQADHHRLQRTLRSITMTTEMTVKPARLVFIVSLITAFLVSTYPLDARRGGGGGGGRGGGGFSGGSRGGGGGFSGGG